MNLFEVAAPARADEPVPGETQRQEEPAWGGISKTVTRRRGSDVETTGANHLELKASTGIVRYGLKFDTMFDLPIRLKELVDRSRDEPTDA